MRRYRATLDAGAVLERALLLAEVTVFDGVHARLPLRHDSARSGSLIPYAHMMNRIGTAGGIQTLLRMRRESMSFITAYQLERSDP